MTSKYYYYISFFFDGQISGFFYRGDEHQLSRKAMAEETQKIARMAFMATKELVKPTDVVYISLTELPQEVAKLRWPGDFSSMQSFNQ